MNQPDITEAANGQSAEGSVAVFTADVRVGPVGAALATASIDFLPLRAAVVAPHGGIDCPPPAPILEDPADGSTTEDPTPTYTGMGSPGASINLTVDGETVDDVTVVDRAGNWFFTPTTPLALGDHTVSATQTVAGATSSPSNENTFTVVDTVAPDAPVITEPVDGSTITDSTPDIVGTGEAGATVTVSIDGTEIGDAVVDEDGDWTVPVTTPLADGPHTATATQTDLAGNESEADQVDFIVDTVAPDAPVITEPVDGSTTTDSTPDIVGTGEASSIVTVSIDGTEIGDAVVDEDGDWTVPVTTPLADGPHTATATQTDEAGNESEADEVDFSIDDTVAPDAPVITAPRRRVDHHRLDPRHCGYR